MWSNRHLDLTPTKSHSSTDPTSQGFLSPAQESVLSKLRAQEQSLNRQNESINAMLGKLDTSFKGKSIVASPVPLLDSSYRPYTHHSEIKENIPSWKAASENTNDEHGIRSAIAASQRQLQKLRSMRDAAMQKRLQQHPIMMSPPTTCTFEMLSSPPAAGISLLSSHLDQRVSKLLYSPHTQRVGAGKKQEQRQSPSATLAALREAIVGVQDTSTAPHLDTISRYHSRPHNMKSGSANNMIDRFSETPSSVSRSVRCSATKKPDIEVHPQLSGTSRQYVEAAKDALTRMRQDRIESALERERMQEDAAAALQRQQQEAIALERYRFAAEQADAFHRSYCLRHFTRQIRFYVQQGKDIYRAEYAHTRRSMKAALDAFARSQRHRVLLSDHHARRCWAVFQRRFFARVRSRFLLLHGAEVAYAYQLRRHFVRLVLSLRAFQWVRRFSAEELHLRWRRRMVRRVFDRLHLKVQRSQQPTLAQATLQRVRRRSKLQSAWSILCSRTHLHRRIEEALLVGHSGRLAQHWRRVCAGIRRLMVQQQSRAAARQLHRRRLQQTHFTCWWERHAAVLQQRRVFNSARRFRYMPRQEPRLELLRLFLRQLKARRDYAHAVQVNTLIRMKMQHSARKLLAALHKFSKWKRNRRQRVSSMIRRWMLQRNWQNLRSRLLLWRSRLQKQRRFVAAFQRAQRFLVAAQFLSKLHAAAVRAGRSKLLLRSKQRRWADAACVAVMQRLRRVGQQRRARLCSVCFCRHRSLQHHLTAWVDATVATAWCRRRALNGIKWREKRRLRLMLNSLMHHVLLHRIQTRAQRALRLYQRKRTKTAFISWCERVQCTLRRSKQHLRSALRFQKYFNCRRSLWQWCHNSATNRYQQQLHAKTKPFTATRYSMLQRWLFYVQQRQEQREQKRSLQRIALRHAMRGAFIALRDAPLYQRWIDGVLADFYTQRLAPLLQRRTLRALQQHRIDGQRKRSDPRLQHHSKRLLLRSLVQWRRWLRNKQLEQEDAALGARNRHLVLLLRYFPLWRGGSRSVAMQREERRRGERFHSLRLLLPSFDRWRRAAGIAALQHQARQIAQETLMVRYWRLWMERQQRFSAGSAAARRCRSLTKAARSSRLTSKQFNLLRDNCLQRKHKRLRRQRAAALNSQRLLRWTLAAWRRFYEAEAHAVLQKLAQHRQQQLRKALRQLRSISWRQITTKAAHDYRRRAYRRALRGKLLMYQQQHRAHQLSLLRATRTWHSKSGLVAMSSWLQYLHMKRRSRLPAILHSLLPPLLVRAALAAATAATAASAPAAATPAPSVEGGERSAWTSAVSTAQYQRIMCAAYFRCKALRHSLRTWLLRRMLTMRRHNQEFVACTAMRYWHAKIAVQQWRQFTVVTQRYKQDSMYAREGLIALRLRQLWRNFSRAKQQSQLLDGARFHRLHRLLRSGWRSWTHFIYADHRRAAAKAFHQRKRQLQRTVADLESSDLLLHDALHRSAAGAAVVDAVELSTAAVDFRLSVQRANIAAAVQQYVQRTLYKTMLLLAEHREHKTVVRRIVRYMRHQFNLKMLFRWRQHAQFRRSCAHDLRYWTRAREVSQVKSALQWLLKQAKLQQAKRRARRVRCVRFFRSWCDAVHRSRVLQQMVRAFTSLHSNHQLRAAMAAWQVDTANERTLSVHLQQQNRTKRLLAVKQLLRVRRSNRHYRTLQIRARSTYTRRILRSVFSNMMEELDLHYRTVEALRHCDRHYERYCCRHVLHQLFYLRRNRVAKTHALQRAFALLVSALRLNRRVVRFDKQQLAAARWHHLRVCFCQLRQRIRGSRSSCAALVASRLRRAQPRLRPASAKGIASGGLTASAAQLAAYGEWNDKLSMRQHLQHMLQMARRWRGQRKRQLQCDQQHQQRRLKRTFRVLLRYSRARCLRRRNEAALQRLWWNLRLRRSFSKLDLRVAARWARAQQLRLLAVRAHDTRLRITLRHLLQAARRAPSDTECDGIAGDAFDGSGDADEAIDE